MIICSILHGLYIIFILNYFKTKYNFAHPITYFNNKLLYHPIGKSNIPTSKVCKLGNILSVWLALFIIMRGFLIHQKMFVKLLKKITLIGLIFAIMLSMLNFNVIIYLIPHFIIEYLYIKYL